MISKAFQVEWFAPFVFQPEFRCFPCKWWAPLVLWFRHDCISGFLCHSPLPERYYEADWRNARKETYLDMNLFCSSSGECCFRMRPAEAHISRCRSFHLSHTPFFHHGYIVYTRKFQQTHTWSKVGRKKSHKSLSANPHLLKKKRNI